MAARYVSVFEQMYLLKRVEVWARNRLNRVVKTPKLQFIDSGLLSTLLNLTPAMVAQDRSRFRHVLETFVYGKCSSTPQAPTVTTNCSTAVTTISSKSTSSLKTQQANWSGKKSKRRLQSDKPI